jgi:hypothetical protein
MKTLQVGEFKSRFAEILEKVIKGEEFVVSYGKSKKNVAAMIPYNEFKKIKKRKIGLYDGKVRYSIAKDFKISINEFLGE